MSRTDKTAPRRVKALYYPNWTVESHDHTNGACELPDAPTVDNVDEYETLYLYRGEWVSYPFDRKDWRTSPRLASCTTCHWSTSRDFQCSSLANACGCRMCSADAYYETPRRKRERESSKRYVRRDWHNEY